MTPENTDNQQDLHELQESRRQFLHTRLGGILFGAVVAGAANSAWAEQCHCNVAHTDRVSGHADNLGLDLDTAPHSAPGHGDTTMHDNQAHADYATSHANIHNGHKNHTNNGSTTGHIDVPHNNWGDNCQNPKGHTNTPHDDHPSHTNHTNNHSDTSTHSNHCGTDPRCQS